MGIHIVLMSVKLFFQYFAQAFFHRQDIIRGCGRKK